MRVPDISVSRLHAQIAYKYNTFYLEDMDSKFGTLLLMQKPLKLTLDQNKKEFKLQIGRSLLTL